MARPIGAYFHVPHGVSNAALLPTVIEFSILGNPKKYADIAEAMGEITEGLSPLDAAYLAAEATRRLNDDLKVPTLSGLGVEEKNTRGETDGRRRHRQRSPGNNPERTPKRLELTRKRTKEPGAESRERGALGNINWN
jgi:alcohol dehydrogenase class IV